MDPLRMIKEPDELALLTEAQRIAGLGMDRARELLRPGVTAHEIATEALYAMMRAGAEARARPSTSTSASRRACSTAGSAPRRWSAASWR
jgi:Xaa-Pro aminopeptidase